MFLAVVMLLRKMVKFLAPFAERKPPVRRDNQPETLATIKVRPGEAAAWNGGRA